MGKAKVAVEEDEEGEFEVCIKGLSFQAYEDDVRTLFGQCGEILTCKLLMRPDGKPKGLAFVKFGKKSAFNNALALNETEQFGRNINVEESQGKPGGAARPGGFGNNAGGFKGNNNYSQEPATITTPTLFIGGLSYNSTVDTITEYFSSTGDVVRARIVSDKETGKVFFCLFSPEDSVTLSSTMLTLPRRPMRPSTEDILTEELSDSIAPVKDPLDPKAASEEEEVDSEEVKEVMEVEAREVSEEAGEHPETQETHVLT